MIIAGNDPTFTVFPVLGSASMRPAMIIAGNYTALRKARVLAGLQ